MAFPTTLPAPTNTPLRGGPTLRWGILAPGGISNDFITSVHQFTDQRAVAVGSRSLERAEQFAAKHGIERAYGSYDQLVADPDVDILYIGSPHSEHREHALLAIAAGKHVLVEKPIALTAAEARDIADAARAAGVFAMEAMWTRFQPKTNVIKQLLDDAALGDLEAVVSDLGFRAGPDPESRILNPALGGGGLLDLGVYTVWFTQFALGTPTAMHANGSLASTGVDDRVSVSLEHASGAHGLMHVTLRADTSARAFITGSEAHVELPPMFIAPGGFTLHRGSDVLEFVDETGFQWRDGLCYQATAVAQHVADGRTEAPEHPLQTTIEQLETIDAARAAVGYPPA